MENSYRGGGREWMGGVRIEGEEVSSEVEETSPPFTLVQVNAETAANKRTNPVKVSFHGHLCMYMYSETNSEEPLLVRCPDFGGCSVQVYSCTCKPGQIFIA